MFIGRQNELTLLREELASPRPSLGVIYGRRRVGKSTLIREAIKEGAHVFYQAIRVTSSLNLEAFKVEIARALGTDELLQGIVEWLALLHYLARSAERHPGLVIVLDEFPYLVDADPALPSTLQKFWDSGAPRTGKLKLLLCGSMISHMEELLAERNPLYGRKTLALDAPKLDEFMGGAFEEICREHARRFSQECFSTPAQEIGRIWQADYDIDVAGKLLDGSMLYGECKWWTDLVGENVLDELIERASRTDYGRDNHKRQFVLYARSGFTTQLQKRAATQPGIVLHTPQTMLRKPRRRTRSAKRPARSQR